MLIFLVDLQVRTPQYILKVNKLINLYMLLCNCLSLEEISEGGYGSDQFVGTHRNV